jgi:hypothetical protein
MRGVGQAVQVANNDYFLNRSEQAKRERALWLADKLVGDYGSEAAQRLVGAAGD